MSDVRERKRRAAAMVREGIENALCQHLEGLFTDAPEIREGRIGQALHQAEHALLALECEENAR